MTSAYYRQCLEFIANIHDAIQFVEEQAIDRVHRLTQTVDVVVYKLTVDKTVEERILNLQEKKRLMAEQAIEEAGVGGRADRKKKGGAGRLGIQELLALFRHDPHDTSAAAGGSQGDEYDSQHERLLDSMAMMMKKKPAWMKENEVYGRRW